MEGGLGTHPSAGANMIRGNLQLDTEGKLLEEINGPLGLATQGWRLQGPRVSKVVCASIYSAALRTRPSSLKMRVCPLRLSSMLVLPSLSL